MEMSNPMQKRSPKFVNKRWGSETWFANNEDHDYCGKILQIKKGKHTSMHFHIQKHEVFYILEGSLLVDYIDPSSGNVSRVELNKGDCMDVEIAQPHQLIAKGSGVTLIEASTFHRDSDSYRIHDNTPDELI